MPLNFPIFLTWLRILFIPLLVALYYLPEGILSMTGKNTVATVLFVAAALTDWLDGWLARRWNQVSSFGAFLDPVADKLMVAAALLILMQFTRVHALAALIIIGREIAISALREWMAQIGASKSVAVHSVGKIKTVAQMIAIPMLLFDGDFLFFNAHEVGTVLLWIAVFLTVLSMFYYIRRAWPQIAERSQPGRSGEPDR